MKNKVLRICIGLIALVMAQGVSTTPAEAAPLSGSSRIVDYYQFCFDVNRAPATSGTTYYTGATASSWGVSCRAWVMPWRAGFPRPFNHSYSWDSACHFYGRSKARVLWPSGTLVCS